ncbi:MAG TPA: hypothetical protein VK718_09175 [Ferruginibacter sp.]|jgi:hypothetical protein|nr:hypothetical protein [Ferruginibacter sp.]
MQKFLDNPEAAFYHITTNDKWDSIQSSGGLISSTGRFFVSRVGELPVLLAIALEQLLVTDEVEEIVFLKLPNRKNDFKIDEIRQDTQAAVEWTQPFHNVILRQYIPLKHIEFMMKIKLGREEPQRTITISKLTQIAMLGQQLNNSIIEIASQIDYSNTGTSLIGDL